MGQSSRHSHFAVLIVEDDALGRAEAVDLCEEAGFTTHEARDADEALLQLERHPEIRVLFTDIEMPGTMDGLTLAHGMQGRRPPLSIIVTSGRIMVAEKDLPRNGLFVAKPYPPEAILRALHDIAAGLGDEAGR